MLCRVKVIFLYHHLLLLLNKYNLFYSLDDEIKKKIGTCVPIYFNKNYKITFMMISLFVTIYYNNYTCQKIDLKDLKFV